MDYHYLQELRNPACVLEPQYLLGGVEVTVGIGLILSGLDDVELSPIGIADRL